MLDYGLVRNIKPNGLPEQLTHLSEPFRGSILGLSVKIPAPPPKSVLVWNITLHTLYRFRPFAVYYDLVHLSTLGQARA